MSVERRARTLKQLADGLAIVLHDVARPASIVEIGGVERHAEVAIERRDRLA